MKRVLMMAALAGLVFTHGAWTEKSFAESGQGDFVSLFNGENLEGWTAYHDSGEEVPLEQSSWNVEDGAIHCSGKGPDYWLVPNGKLGDFVLRLEFKLTTDANSGVFLRAPETGAPAWKGFEIQVIDDVGYEPNKHSTGSIYDVLSPMRNMSHPIGEWNSMEITCKGTKVKVVHNGATVIWIDFAELTEPIGKFDFPYSKIPKEGYIGVQNHGGEVWYRNVEIKKLNDK